MIPATLTFEQAEGWLMYHLPEGPQKLPLDAPTQRLGRLCVPHGVIITSLNMGMYELLLVDVETKAWASIPVSWEMAADEYLPDELFERHAFDELRFQIARLRERAS